MRVKVWKTECFSIMLPVLLQIAMERHTKDAFPLTTEGTQMTNFNIGFSDLFFHIWEVVELKKSFNTKVRIGAGMAMIFLYTETWLWTPHVIQQRRNNFPLWFSEGSQLPFLSLFSGGLSTYMRLHSYIDANCKVALACKTAQYFNCWHLYA